MFPSCILMNSKVPIFALFRKKAYYCEVDEKGSENQANDILFCDLHFLSIFVLVILL